MGMIRIQAWECNNTLSRKWKMEWFIKSQHSDYGFAVPHRNIVLLLLWSCSLKFRRQKHTYVWLTRCRHLLVRCSYYIIWTSPSGRWWSSIRCGLHGEQFYCGFGKWCHGNVLWECCQTWNEQECNACWWKHHKAWQHLELWCFFSLSSLFCFCFCLHF